ncbi:MAG: glycerate kinase, partial [Cyanobacteria bacterium]|nr:glycerate kinase [Cyanobacteriota bacterium]
MKVVIAPCAYKGYFSPVELAIAMERAVRERFPDADIELVPLADGGDGTIDALEWCMKKKHERIERLDDKAGNDCEGFERFENVVTGPIGEAVKADWLSVSSVYFDSSGRTAEGCRNTNSEISRNVAIIELASASGIAYLRERGLSALDAHTMGVGELLEIARTSGHKQMILTVGGSASTDGGTGVLSVLGARFLDKDGNVVAPGGRGLIDIEEIDLSGLSAWEFVEMKIATDVNSP